MDFPRFELLISAIVSKASLLCEFAFWRCSSGSVCRHATDDVAAAPFEAGTADFLRINFSGEPICHQCSSARLTDIAAIGSECDCCSVGGAFHGFYRSRAWSRQDCEWPPLVCDLTDDFSEFICPLHCFDDYGHRGVWINYGNQVTTDSRMCFACFEEFCSTRHSSKNPYVFRFPSEGLPFITVAFSRCMSFATEDLGPTAISDFSGHGFGGTGELTGRAAYVFLLSVSCTELESILSPCNSASCLQLFRQCFKLVEGST